LTISDVIVHQFSNLFETIILKRKLCLFNLPNENYFDCSKKSIFSIRRNVFSSIFSKIIFLHPLRAFIFVISIVSGKVRVMHGVHQNAYHYRNALHAFYIWNENTCTTRVTGITYKIHVFLKRHHKREICKIFYMNLLSLWDMKSLLLFR
jgi:hypothetical protein